jgi:hypothetical protein
MRTERDISIGPEEIVGKTIRSVVHTPWRSSPEPPHECADFYLQLDSGLWVDLNPWQSRLAVRSVPSAEPLEWREDILVEVGAIQGRKIIAVDNMKRVFLDSGMMIQVELWYLGSQFFFVNSLEAKNGKGRGWAWSGQPYSDWWTSAPITAV